MDAWYYRTSVACDALHSISSHLRWYGPLHLAFPGDVAYACTDIQQVAKEEEKKNKTKKVTLHILTHSAIQLWCELTSLVVYIDNKICDIRERIVTVRSEICTTNIRSLGFWDIRDWVILWGLMLRNLGCMLLPHLFIWLLHIYPCREVMFIFSSVHM